MTAGWTTRAFALARMALLVAVAPIALAACGGEGPPPGLLEPPEPGSASAPLETPQKGDVIEVTGDLGGPVAHGLPGPTCRTPEIEARIQQLVADQAKESDQLRVDRLRLTEDTNQTGWATTAAAKEQHEGEVRVDQGDVDHDEIALQLTNNELAKLEALPPCRMTTVASAPPATLPPPAPPHETNPLVHDLADDESVPTCDDGTAKQKIAKLHDADVEAGVQLDQAMGDGDEADVISLNEDMDFYERWIQILSGLRPCSETASSTVGAPPASGASAVKPIGRLGALPVLAIVAQASYTGLWADGEHRIDGGSLAAQFLMGGASYGLVGGPKGSPTPWYQGNLELQGAWSDSSTSGGTSSAGQFNGAYLMNAGQVRFGPVGGYQGSTTGDVSSHTYTYGGYGEAFVSDQFSLFGRGGGFSTGFDQSGVSAGGGLKFNPTPNVTLSATGDYAHWTAPSGYYQYQATLQAEVMPWPRKPVSIYAGWTYSQSGFTDLDSFHSSNNELSIGLHFWANAPSPMTLEDRERNGPVVGLIPSF